MVTLNKLFKEKVTNTKYSLKVQLFMLKIRNRTTMSNHIRNFRSPIRHLVEAKAPVVVVDDAKSILLENVSSKYNNATFALNQITS